MILKDHFSYEWNVRIWLLLQKEKSILSGKIYTFCPSEIAG